MKKLIPYLLLLLSVSAAGQEDTATYRPTGYKSWEHKANPDRGVVLLGGAIQNYLDGTDWKTINNDFVTDSDTIKAHNAVLRTTVTQDGLVTVVLTKDGTEYTVRQELIRVVWLNTSTKNWINIASVSWSTPSVDSNVVDWDNIIPGVDYQVVKHNGSVGNRIIFRPVFLDSAVVLFNQRMDSADIAIGNVVRYSLTNIDDAEVLFDGVSSRALKRWGKEVFELRKNWLQVVGHDSAIVGAPPIRQRWINQNGNLFCIEYVKMGEVKEFHERFPGAALYHNDEITLDESDAEDCFTNNTNNPTRALNYGGSNYLYQGDSTGSEPDEFVNMLRFDFTDLPSGATIDTVSLRVSAYSEDSSDVGYINTYYWREGTSDGTIPTTVPGATDYNAVDSASTIDDVAWATGDMSSSDWNFGPSGIYGTLRHTASDPIFWGTFKAGGSDNFVTLVQGWADGDSTNGGFSMWARDGSASNQIRSSEAALYQPELRIVYTEAVTSDTRRRRLLLEN